MQTNSQTLLESAYNVVLICVEVKGGEPAKCDPGMDKYLHLSQVSLGEVKKGNDPILIYVNVNGQKLVLGTLSPEKCTHISLDLVFEKEFELSHNWKNGIVYFCGYKTMMMEQEEEYPSDGFPSKVFVLLRISVCNCCMRVCIFCFLDSGFLLIVTYDFMDSESDSDQELPLKAKQNGMPEVKDKQSKPSADNSKAKLESLVSKPKAKITEPNKADKLKDEDDEDDDDDEDEDDDESEEDESDDDEDMVEAGDDSDDEDGVESSEEDEATPKKVETGKKRVAEAESKTPGKKAKLATPTNQKTGADGKKGGQTATPRPSKQAGKTPASSDKAKPQTPKSGGSVSCKSCSKTFNSENALQAHTKAKHSAGK
ncbi:histone deacetylase HDT1-like isoform X2 [Magnolia sinica]|uniref:histone deacetylase HDT1-like isoform X2 n=1 Tax=Magnolia sinica TaxID=86752 RepID=UPI00265ADF82|nr:histone deacetylase HDT1-like isoform X2 [Magnolia sinica]